MNKTISEKKADPVPSKKLLMIVVILLSAVTCGITSAKAQYSFLQLRCLRL